MADELTPGTPEIEAPGTPGEIQDGGSVEIPDDGSGQPPEPTIEQLRADLASRETALAEEQRKNAQLLGEKTNVERERERLEQQRASLPSTPDPRQAQVEHDLREQQQDINQLRYLAENGDVHARVLLRTAEFTYRQTLQLHEEISLGRLPEADANSVRTLRQERPNLSVQDAREIVQGRTRIAELEKQPAKPNGTTLPGAPTSPRPVSVTPIQKEWTADQYGARLDQLSEQGKWEERRQLVLKRTRGEINVRV